VKRATISAELRGPLVVLLTVVPALALAGWWIYSAVQSADAYQQHVRLAQVARSRTLRYQLDEETGLRGYLASGERVYLEPYASGLRAMPAALGRLQNTLSSLGTNELDSAAAGESRLNSLWVSTVAEPLVRSPARSPRSLELQRQGKRIMDAFRADDEQLQLVLGNAATSADRRSERALFSTLVYVLAALAAIAASFAVFGYLQARTSRRAFENRVLYENQKRIADSLQAAFLIKDLPTSPNIGLHATYIPASDEAAVGGDWYDAFELPDKRILFSIGDVAGHGLEAAVVMSRTRQSIIAAALHENDPGKVLERANESMLLQDTRMVTAICGYVDPETLEVVYATAGHPAPVLAVPGQSPAFLPYKGIPLGVIEGATYRTFMAHAFDGAVLVLYTDGVIEHKRNLFEGEARLLEAARLSVGQENPALAIQQYVFDASPPTDDVAILTVTFKKSGVRAPRTAQIDALQLKGLVVTEDKPGVSHGDATLEQPHHGIDEIDRASHTLLPTRA